MNHTTHHTSQRNSKHHKLLLTIGWIVAVIAIVFVLWQWTQFPHEAFPIRETKVEIQKKPQPKMPATDTQQLPSQQ